MKDIDHYTIRINLLSARKADNSRIIAKLRRKIRKLNNQ